MSQTGKIQRQESIQAEIEPEKINQHLEMIVGSKHFRQAKSLEKFLRYVVAKKLAGEDCELKEYTIGLEVFHRGQEFDPRTDAVVRVQAAQLRKKLASFYQEEGAAS
jgi:adenylate cyclase